MWILIALGLCLVELLVVWLVWWAAHRCGYDLGERVGSGINLEFEKSCSWSEGYAKGFLDGASYEKREHEAVRPSRPSLDLRVDLAHHSDE